MIDKHEYERATFGCSRGVRKCDQIYKRKLKYMRNQYKNLIPNSMNLEGKMIKPTPCKICTQARNFAKTCDIQYENNFYGYARENEQNQVVYLHWSNQWFPNFGTTQTIKDGDMMPLGVTDKKAYDDLFRLSAKCDNLKVLTPKNDEFISGYISENTSGPYKGRLQWTKWFRHSLTFYNWTKLVKTTIENKSMQLMINQPKLMIAKMIYDQNKLISEAEVTPKTPCNCEPISREPWILASVTMVAFLGIRPVNRNIFENYGGISKVGKMDFFTFLQHIDKPENLIQLSNSEPEKRAIQPLRMHSMDLSRFNDETFWSNVSYNFKNMPFTKNDHLQLDTWKNKNRDYKGYRDNFSVDFLPYHNSAPYFNSAHVYNGYFYNDTYHKNYNYSLGHNNTQTSTVNRNRDQNMPFEQYERIAHRESYRPYEPSNSRKRSTSSRNSFISSRSSRKYEYDDERRNNINSYREELRDLILSDINQEIKRKSRETSSKRLKSDRERKNIYSTERVRCREDSGREDNAQKREESVDSSSSCSSFENENRIPTYQELVDKIEIMEKEKRENFNRSSNDSDHVQVKQRWRTQSSDSEDS